MKHIIFSFVALLFVSCARKIYVVRHAEKQVLTDSASMKTMGSDVPLSDPGLIRAFNLRNGLKKKHITQIWSTPTRRTMSTADPLSKYIKVPITNYKNTDSLVKVVKAGSGNVLIVGHSNTVDDIVNGLCGKKEVDGDLDDKEYDNLFYIKMTKKGAVFTRLKYGKASKL